MTTLAITSLLIALAAAAFMILERVAPGRELPNAPGWYGRALIVTLFQVGITLATNKLWTHLFGSASLFDLHALQLPAFEGLPAGWSAPSSSTGGTGSVT
jgi:hypothetical protein